MSALMKYTCDNCDFSIESWTDGASYIQFPEGERQYFCHPAEDQVYDYMRDHLGHEASQEERNTLRKKYVGFEGDHVCKQCFKMTSLDPERDPMACKHCKNRELVATYELEQTPCFKCNQGQFDEGKMVAIS